MKNFDKQVQELKQIVLDKKLEVKLVLEVKDLTLTSTYDVVDTETGDVYEFSVYDSKYLFRGDDTKRRYAEMFILKKLFFEMLSYEDKLKSLQLVSTYFNLEDFNKYEESFFENRLKKDRTSTETFNELAYYIQFDRKQNTLGFDVFLKIKRQTDNTYRLDFTADIVEKIIEQVRDSGIDEKYYYTTIEQADFDSFTDVINLFNTLYETASLEFNKILSEEIKKATQEEQQKQQEEKSKDKSQDSQDGEQGEGDGGQESLEDLINDILNQQESGTDGQSTNPKDSIDLEDFMDEVQKGNIDNSDFTEQYNNKELQEQMKDLKSQSGQEESGQDGQVGQGGEGSQEKMQQSQNPSESTIKGVAQSVAKFLDTSVEDLKRRFPTEKSVNLFFIGQSQKELNEIAIPLELPRKLTSKELQLILSQNLINDLKNT